MKALAASGILLVVILLALTVFSNEPGSPPTKSSQLSTSAIEVETSPSYAVAVQDSIAYAGFGRLLVLIDVSDPHAPRELGSVDAGGIVKSVRLRGRRAFVGASGAGLRIIDVSNSAAPVVADSIVFEDRVEGVDIDGSYAFVAARSLGLIILDVSSRPVEVSRHQTTDQALDVEVEGSYAYVATLFDGVRAIDISDPRNPAETGFAEFDSYDGGGARKVVVEGVRLYSAEPETGMRVSDLSDPADPKFIDMFKTLAAPAGIAVQGRHALVADQQGGLAVLDVQDPSRRTEMARISLPGSPQDVVTAGSHAYVASAEGGLRIVDVTDPERPREVGFYNVRDDVRDVVVSDSYIYAAGKHNGISIRRERNLEQVAFIAGPAERLLKVNDDLIVASAAEGVRIIDIRNPAAPKAMALIDTPGEARAVAFEPGVLIVADGDRGVRSYGMDTGRPIAAYEPPPQPSTMTLKRTPPAAWDVRTTSGFVYAAFDDGLHILTADLRYVSRVSTSERIYRIAVTEGRLYAACDDGLRVFNLENPDRPSLIAIHRTTSFATGLAVTDGNIIASDLSGYISVLEGNNSTMNRRKVADRLFGVSAVDGRIYLAAGLEGVKRLE